MRKVFSRKDQKPNRRELRNNMPKAEVVLWSKLKGRQLRGLKFRRQHSVEQYVMDFYCPELKLAIEVDGPSHYEPDAELHDRRRQALIESFGISVLRFTNTQIYENLEGVWQAIEEKAAELTGAADSRDVRRRSRTPTPLNPPLGRGE